MILHLVLPSFYRKMRILLLLEYCSNILGLELYVQEVVTNFI